MKTVKDLDKKSTPRVVHESFFKYLTTSYASNNDPEKNPPVPDDLDNVNSNKDEEFFDDYNFLDLPLDTQLYMFNYLSTKEILTKFCYINKYFYSLSTNPISHEKGVVINIRSIYLNFPPSVDIIKLSKKISVLSSGEYNENPLQAFRILYQFLDILGTANKIEKLKLSVNFFKYNKLPLLFKLFEEKYVRLKSIELVNHRGQSEFKSYLFLSNNASLFDRLCEIKLKSDVLPDIFQSFSKSVKLKDSLFLNDKLLESEKLKTLYLKNAHIENQVNKYQFRALTEKYKNLTKFIIVNHKSINIVNENLKNMRSLTIVNTIDNTNVKINKSYGNKNVKKLKFIFSFNIIDSYLDCYKNINKLIVKNSNLCQFPTNLPVNLNTFVYIQNSDLFIPPKYDNYEVLQSSLEIKEKAFCDLKFLKKCVIRFDLFGKRINLPKNFCKLVSLENIELKSVAIDYDIFKEMKHINYIVIEDSRIRSDLILDNIKREVIFKNLINIAKSGKKYKANIINSSIEKFEVINCDIVTSLKGLKNLHSVNFERNGIKIDNNELFAANLIKINLNSNNLESFPTGFYDLIFIEEIRLEDNKISDIDFMKIQQLESLIVFDINENPVYDKLENVLIKESLCSRLKLVNKLTYGAGKKLYHFDKIIKLKNYYDIRLFKILDKKDSIGSILQISYFSIIVNTDGYIIKVREKLVIDAFQKRRGHINRKHRFYFEGNDSLMRIVSKLENKWIDFANKKEVENYDYQFNFCNPEKKFIRKNLSNYEDYYLCEVRITKDEHNADEYINI